MCKYYKSFFSTLAITNNSSKQMHKNHIKYLLLSYTKMCPKMVFFCNREFFHEILYKKFFR